MRSLQRYRSRDKLTRWVQRHGQMTTLFRAPGSGMPASPQPKSLPAVSGTVAVPSQAAAILPGEQSVETQTLQPRLEEPVQTKLDPAAAPSHPAAVPARAPTSAEAPKSIENDDKEWRRLQAIFRKHQSQEETRSSSPAEQAQTVEPAQPGLPAPTERSAAIPRERPASSTVSGPLQRQANLKSSSPATQTPSNHRISDESVYKNEPTLKEESSIRGASMQNRLQQPAEPVPVRRAVASPSKSLQPGMGHAGQENTASTRKRPTQDTPSIQAEEGEPRAAPNSPQDGTIPPVQPNLVQRAWRGLRSIFRRQQEPGQPEITPKQALIEPAAKPTEPDLRQTLDDQNGSADHTDEMETQAVRAISSNEFVQRSPGAAQSHESREIRQTEARLPSVLPSQPIIETQLAEPHLAETASENEPEESAAQPLAPQVVPLQDVWNVQRMEDPESHQEESSPRFDSGAVGSRATVSTESALMDEPIVSSRVNNRPVETDRPPALQPPSFDPSLAPVEILPPSRPRPPRTQVAAASPPVQRQPEKRNVSRQVTESSLVDTAIGPLPSDLWSLLGQQPPLTREQPSRGPQAATRPKQADADLSQTTLMRRNMPTPQTHDPSPLSDVLQRQAELEAPATSTGQQQEPASEDEKKNQGEPDLQDLAQKVYAEIRRRLNVESERTRHSL